MNVKRATVKQAKWVKSPWYGGQWLKYKYGEAWQTGYVTLHKPAKANRGSNHWMAGNVSHAPCHYLEHHPRP